MMCTRYVRYWHKADVLNALTIVRCEFTLLLAACNDITGMAIDFGDDAVCPPLGARILPKKYAAYAKVFEPFQPPEVESNAMAHGTPEEAKAMLDRAVVALKEDKTKALDMFNKGYGDGFKDSDLYVYCANASDGILTAHPKLKGKQLKGLKGEKGFPFGKEIMEKATEGKISEVTYWWPLPDSAKALEKHTFFTKVGDQICGVGYYKE